MAGECPVVRMQLSLLIDFNCKVMPDERNHAVEFKHALGVLESLKYESWRI
jgi:hypothetical protein